jgi:hypothetical protein
MVCARISSSPVRTHPSVISVTRVRSFTVTPIAASDCNALARKDS